VAFQEKDVGRDHVGRDESAAAPDLDPAHGPEVREGLHFDRDDRTPDEPRVGGGAEDP